MKFTLTIDTGNAAFGEDGMDRAAEVARLLRHAAAQVEPRVEKGDVWFLLDSNGNTVGSWRLK